jgi:hypothetical protein
MDTAPPEGVWSLSANSVGQAFQIRGLEEAEQ